MGELYTFFFFALFFFLFCFVFVCFCLFFVFVWSRIYHWCEVFLNVTKMHKTYILILQFSTRNVGQIEVEFPIYYVKKLIFVVHEQILTRVVFPLLSLLLLIVFAPCGPTVDFSNIWVCTRTTQITCKSNIIHDYMHVGLLELKFEF